MPNKLHVEILNNDQRKLLPLIQLFVKDFYLVGGTAIALQLGHRRSIDFDLFSSEPINQRKIRAIISNAQRISRVIIDDKDEYTIVVSGVKITFLHYPFQVKTSKRFDEYAKMPDISSLAAMKAYALGRRAKWKDYIDLYWIMKKHCGITDIIKKAKSIFGVEFNEKNFRKQLAFHKDIDFSEKVDWLPSFQINDKQVKDFLLVKSLEE